MQMLKPGPKARRKLEYGLSEAARPDQATQMYKPSHIHYVRRGGVGVAPSHPAIEQIQVGPPLMINRANPTIYREVAEHDHFAFAHRLQPKVLVYVRASRVNSIVSK